ncbi:hypothetical protein MSIBF_A320004 [groundwater metagenome]|uniref:UDP-N-acetylglucosamine 2-epimerase domain-containing protein n=1 Tax=groundwater metagenome TaxID=717931 RepID=A0A098EC47_9ZZZZ
MRTFIILEEKHIDITYKFIKNKNINFITIYAPEKLDRRILTNFKDMEFECISLTAEYSEEPLEWFKKWYSKPIIDGKNFKEIAVYNNLSLHWMFDMWLYEGRFYFKNIPQILSIVSSISKILQNSDQHLFFVDDKSDFSELLKETCTKKNIKFSTIKLPLLDRAKLSLRKVKEKNIYPYLRIFAKFSRYISRCIYWKYVCLLFDTKKERKNKEKIFIFSGDRWKKTYNIVYKKWIGGDEHFENIITYLYKKGYFIKFIDKSESTKVRHGIKEKIIRSEFEYMSYEGYISINIIFKVIFEALKLRKKYSNLINNEKFKESFEYEGINFYKIIKPKISFMFSMFLIEALFYIELAKKIVKVEKPDTIVTTGETNPVVRPLIFEAKRRGISIIAMQHGAIAPAIPDFNHENEDVQGEFLCPFPDKMLAYGEHHKKIYEECAKFPRSILLITGSSRYDFLICPDKVFDRKKIIKELNLDENKKLIVWLTDTTTSNDLVEIVFKAIKRLPELQIIIKMHPGEYDIKKYKVLIEKIGVDAKVAKDFNIYNIIYVSDAVLMEFSTAAIETTILNKPIIILNLSGGKDILPYVEESIALGIYKEEDLIINIKKVLYDKETQEKLKNAREKFVYEHAYLQDEKATERICNLIEEFINKNG